MEEKEFIKISNRCLSLCYDLAGKSKDKNKVVELLVKDVFKKIPTDNLMSTCDSLRLNISNLTEPEQDAFEEGLEIFLRQNFGVSKKCIACKNEIRVNAKNCPKCGQTQTSESQKEIAWLQIRENNELWKAIDPNIFFSFHIDRREIIEFTNSKSFINFLKPNSKSFFLKKRLIFDLENNLVEKENLILEAKAKQNKFYFAYKLTSIDTENLKIITIDDYKSLFESKGFLEYIITDNSEEAEDFVSSDTEIILLDEDEIIKLYEQEYSRAAYLNFNRYENLSEKFINRKKKENKNDTNSTIY